MYQFLGPCLSGKFVVVLTVAVVLLLVFDNGVGDAPSEEVLPPDRLLVCSSGAVHGMSLHWIRLWEMSSLMGCAVLLEW